MMGSNRFTDPGTPPEHLNQTPGENGRNGTENMLQPMDKVMPSEGLLAAEDFVRPEQAEALLTISSLLSADLNPGNVLRSLLQQLCALFRANRSAVFLRKNLQKELTQQMDAELRLFREEEPLADMGPVICAANFGLSTEYIEKIIKFYEDKEFNKLQTIRNPVYIADAQNDIRLNGLRELSQREGFQTMLTLPLLYRQSLIGILVLYHNQRRIYSNEELRLLSFLSNQAALAITNARLYEEALQREKEATLLAEASRILNSSLKLRQVLPGVVALSTKMLGNTALVYIVRENTDLLYPVSFLTRVIPPQGVTEVSPVKSARPIKIGQGVVGKVVQTGTPLFLREISDLQRMAPFLREIEGVTALLAVPLKARGSIIGALVTYNITYGQTSSQVIPLDERQVTLALALGDRSAVAIENARMYEAEKLAQRAKDEFLALIAHELRTPVTSLKGYNRLLAKRLDEQDHEGVDFAKTAENLRHYAEVMGSQVDRLQFLIEDLTSISEIETNQLELHKRPTDIAALVRNRVSELERQLKAARLPRVVHQFEVRSNPNSVIAEVDPSAYERVIQAVLNNAVKFSPKGGLIRVRVQQVLDEVTVTVQDEGIGIKPEDQLKIFERFYKADSSPARANGMGLGLYIGQGLMRAMDGHIEVESEEGRGSTFTISLRTHVVKENQPQ